MNIEYRRKLPTAKKVQEMYPLRPQDKEQKAKNDEAIRKIFTGEDERLLLSYFNAFGETEIIPESLMDVVTGVSGSSPAFVYMFIEAMADAAVAEGMKRPQAYKFAAQTLRGASTMVLETGKHPGELKDAVCSPGGTTIEGVCALEAAGFRTAIIDGVTASIEKSRDMSK